MDFWTFVAIAVLSSGVVKVLTTWIHARRDSGAMKGEMRRELDEVRHALHKVQEEVRALEEKHADLTLALYDRQDRLAGAPLRRS